MTGKEIREKFLDFFRGKDHLVLPSAALIPEDPSTLFTSAGMQPFVPYFLGNEKPPHPRLATVQKSLRADDVDEVGHTARHCTFFEMLGNFSFGDYFKKEAIAWGWEFVREHLGLPAEWLWVSVYEEDEEAADLWAEVVGVPRDRIVRFGKKDNWWGPVGASGPCGPCSEIFLDRGPEYGSEESPAKGSGDRYVELWNLVFQQFDQQPDGRLEPLPQPGIDTGAGLERVAAAMQGVPTIFETDLMKPIIDRLLELVHEDGRAEVSYGANAADDVALKVIADHSRALTFALADGAFPSNKGRGSVLRRLLRRAAFYGRQLGLEEPFLHQLPPTIADVMGDVYPEVRERMAMVTDAIKAEEEGFLRTLDRNLPRVEEALAAARAAGQERVDGGVAFDLLSTYGVPLEMVEQMAAAEGLTVDREGFAEAEEQHRRVSSTDEEFSHGDLADDALKDLPPDTPFLGYEQDTATATVRAIAVGAGLDPDRNILTGGERREALGEGEEGFVVLDRTPFYAEAGGQVGDIGVWEWEGGRAAVTNTLKDKNNRFLHLVRTLEGALLTVGAEVTAQVDAARRDRIRRAHTATHLLHRALRKELGPHVAQAGSLVEPERLRFDFSHYAAVPPDQLARIEAEVNENILANWPVEAVQTTLQEARAEGALALFGEKYGAEVRLVRVGNLSRELCGGTHVRATGDIGLLCIVSEGSIGAGLRRLEALVGRAALDYLHRREAILTAAVAQVGAQTAEQLPARIEALQQRVRDLEAELERLQRQGAKERVQDLVSRAETVNGARLLATAVEGVEPKALQDLADELCAALNRGVVILGLAAGAKVSFVCKVADVLVSRGVHAGDIVRAAAQVAGGRGGGRPTFAQAGGKDPSKLAEALARGAEVARDQLRRS